MSAGAGRSVPAADRPVQVAVIAADEWCRAALSAAIAARPAQRVACSTSLEDAADALERHAVDALVGAGNDPADFARFRDLAARHPHLVSVLLVSDPAGLAGAAIDVARGATAAVVAPRADPALPRMPPAADELDHDRLAALSGREREVLALTAQGLSIKEISRHLHRSYGTVAAHRVHIMRKLDLHDRVALTRFAIRTGCVVA